jgi:hypothetical protein
VDADATAGAAASPETAAVGTPPAGEAWRGAEPSSETVTSSQSPVPDTDAPPES